MIDDDEENSYGEESEEDKANHETSILERHEKISNSKSIDDTPSHKSSLKHSKFKHETNEGRHLMFNADDFHNGNVPEVKSKVTSIKTEKDIKEDIHIESSHEVKKTEEANEEEVMVVANNKLMIDLPQSFLNSVKYLRMKHQKEQLNSFMKFHRTTEPNTQPLPRHPLQQISPPSNTQNNNNEGKAPAKGNNNTAIATNPSSTTALPRISSASNLSNQMTLQKPSLAKINSKRIKFGIPYHNRNVKLIPKEDKLLLQLEKDNKDLFNELQAVNQQLNILLKKKLKHKPEHKQQDSNIHQSEMKEMERSSMKKTLSRLIDEYNQLYRVYYVSRDNDSKDKLEEQLAQITKQHNDKLKANQELEAKIKLNEFYLLNSKSEQASLLQDITLLNAKNELIKKKAKEEEAEQERMRKVIVDEEERIKEMKEKLAKLKEILLFYEETPESILHKNPEKGEKEKLIAKYNTLKKRNTILQHSRVSMSKTHQIEISNQKKEIDHLQSTINEVNDVLESLN